MFVFLRITVGCLVQYLLCSATVSKVQSWLYFGVLPLAVWCNSCFALPLSQSFNPDCISVSYCWLFGAIFVLLRHSLTVLVLIVFLCITAGCLVQYLIGSVTVSKFQFWLYFCVLLLVLDAMFALLCHSLKVTVLIVFMCITAGCLVQYLLCSVTVSKFQSWLYLRVLLLVYWCNFCFAPSISKFQSWLYFCVLLLVVWCNICFAPS